MRRIRVLIVEDSAVVREFLRQIISADPRLEVAAAVASAEEALDLLHSIAPDVISLDIRLPGMQGLEATRRIMSERPTPIVVVSAASESDELNLTMEALRAGALAVVEKPAATSHRDYDALADRLREQLVIMSEVRVVRQNVKRVLAGRYFKTAPGPAGGHYRILGIVASTGGPRALMELLGGLGPSFPLPIVVVQHMTPSFQYGFGSWLASVTPFRVELVADKAPLSPGKLYLAHPGRHLLADTAWTWVEHGNPDGNHCPSGNILFESLARHARHAGIGVLLTGMGEDGARCLLDLRRAGGYTIAEHQSTAVVYGMPAAAVRMGAACETLPLPSIAGRIREMAGPAAKEKA
jgi:two-component system chemotaxis response regulator CheB